MTRNVSALIAAAAVLSAALVTHGGSVAVPNFSFEDYEAITPGTSGGWASLPSGHSDVTSATLLVNDEFWSNPSSFGSGWQFNQLSSGTQNPLSGRYGLAHPSDAQHAREADHSLSSPFAGDFIGFVNLDPAGDGPIQSVQSSAIGMIMEGTYTLNLAVGARRALPNWNDVTYGISLVADPVSTGGPGTSGGSTLGDIARVTLVPSLVPAGAPTSASLFDLQYTLVIDADDPNIGKEFAIRIDVENPLTRQGLASSLFTQANFDNARLDFTPIPEPSTLALVTCGVALVAFRCWRRRSHGAR